MTTHAPINAIHAAELQAVALTDRAVSALQAEQLDANRLLGQMQMASSISVLIETITTAQLLEVREQKLYRHLKGQTKEINGEQVPIDTWEGFCRAIGTSRPAVEEKFAQMKLLGETAYQRATELGLTRQHFRKMRRLDEADQQVVIGELEAAVGDKEAIVELVEAMASKHAKQKEELEKELEAAKAEAKATARIVADKNKKISELDAQIIKQETVTADEKLEAAVLLTAEADVKVHSAMGVYEQHLYELLEAYPDHEPTRIKAAGWLRDLAARVYELQMQTGLADVMPHDDSWMAEYEAEQAGITDKA